MKAFEILRNHPDNSKGWKVFISFMNITLWIALADVIFLLAISSQESIWRTIAAALCTIILVFCMFWAHSVDAPLLSNRRTPPAHSDFIQKDIEAASHPGNISLKDLI